MSEHRDKAVEAAKGAFLEIPDGTTFLSEELKQLPKHEGTMPAGELAERMVTAAETHLERMYLERFKEAVLSREAREAGFRAAGPQLSSVEPPTPAALGRALDLGLEAALSKAQELMEEGS